MPERITPERNSMMTIRETLEEMEKRDLSPYAALSRNSAGRDRPEEEDGVRTVYMRDRDRILYSKAFRWSFLIFFCAMFGAMLWNTCLVFNGSRELRQAVTLLWTFRLPWHWAYHGGTAPWIAQFAYGFYSVMLTSTMLGLITMALFRPRSWCVYCPMGMATQLICTAKEAPPEKN